MKILLITLALPSLTIAEEFVSIIDVDTLTIEQKLYCSEWTPNAESIPFDDSFEQTRNCYSDPELNSLTKTENRSELGLKSCHFNGTSPHYHMSYSPDQNDWWWYWNGTALAMTKNGNPLIHNGYKYTYRNLSATDYWRRYEICRERI